MFSLNPTTQEISQARIFEEPLVPVGASPTPAENAALTAALLGYSKRSSPDDFSSLTDLIEAHPQSPWNASLLINLGLEYYNTGHYSKTMEVWSQAWDLAMVTTDPKGKAVADRACGELAYMYSRLGRMPELEALLKSVEFRAFSGPATERISGARQGLSNMQNRPETAFRCGSHALHRIKISVDPQNPGTQLIHASESTREGFTLVQLGELSQRLGLYFQMAFRDKGSTLVVPSVVHFKIDHFAAIIRQDGDRYLLQDPTFWNDRWVTRAALEDEASGYFLIPPGELARGWRAISPLEGEKVRGKGSTCCSDPGPLGPNDPHIPDDPCKGMAVSRVHLMLCSLNIIDEPVGYSPPVGPAVRFTVRYNQRDFFQPGNFNYSNLGPKWTFDWLSYITDVPSSPSADVDYYIMGGGTRTFTGFDSRTKAYAFQRFDQTKLIRTSPDTYEMVSRDGSKKIFSQSDGSLSSTRKVFLTKVIDPFGNAVSLAYDPALRVTDILDAIGQNTAISYGHPTDIHKITRVTDPFGRFATFDYDKSNGRLIKITDVMGIASEFTYDSGDFITTLTTPYGVTSFSKSENGATRALETVYPDGNRERVECHQTNPRRLSDPPRSVPTEMATFNDHLLNRDTFYWSKIACASAFGDQSKAKFYHWLHADLDHTSGILESIKEPLEGRVWYDYAGQPSDDGGPIFVGTTNKPAHIGRVLDDGSTQLYTYEYNGFGNVTKTIDPVGRTFSYIYDANGIDLLETRQTREGQSELLSQATYNDRHLPLTEKDAAGQTTTYTYNISGQVLTKTNAKNETTAYVYDVKGNVTSIEGPLPSPDDTVKFTYDSVGRLRTRTDESGYTLTFDYDNLDRLTKITYPDASTTQFTYTRLDLTLKLDRAGRQTSYEYDSVRQKSKETDPLNRATLFQWCKCGDLKSLTDPMGRTTTWGHDVQGRVTNKQYADGSRVNYLYENLASRLRQKIDERLQVKQYTYNRDGTVSEVSYANATITTPAVSYAYDSNYSRLTSMRDGTGTTLYSYHPITRIPTKGAGKLASIDGPLPDDTITYTYDELGRLVARGINGVPSAVVFDGAGRITSETNALGTFNYAYDGATMRRSAIRYPNGQTTAFKYLDNLSDQRLGQITHTQGATPISEFSYGYDLSADRITTWSQKFGLQDPLIYTFGYDTANQLTSASGAHSGSVKQTFAYTYDPSGNRLTEVIDGTTNVASYNALNQLTTIAEDPGTAATYEWDAEHRVVAVSAGNQRTEFTYDGVGCCVRIRQLVNGSEVSDRRFLWCDDEICEERVPAGTVSKRFFAQGIKIETGAAAGGFYYTRDHLGSIRELTDSSGNIRVRYTYDPFGRRTRATGDLDSDFGFAGMFWLPESGLNMTRFRAYDPTIARWLSRDPFPNTEAILGPNLYAYVGNDPVNRVDPDGLFFREPSPCEALAGEVFIACEEAGLGFVLCTAAAYFALIACKRVPNPPPNLCLSPTPGPGSGPAPGPEPQPGPGPSPQPDNGASGGGGFGGGGSSDSY